MNEREQLRQKRHRRIRLKLHGTQERPRLVIKRSLNNISAQLVDDVMNKVIFSSSTYDKEIRAKLNGKSGNVKAATLFGEQLSRIAKEKGIKKIIFDRAGYLYHGRVKALADALRKGGLEF